MWGVGQARTASRGVGICGASLTAHSRRQGWPEAALTPLAIVSLVCLVARWPGLLLPGTDLGPPGWGGASEQPIYFSNVIPKG